MSGIRGRIGPSIGPTMNLGIKGFNESISKVDSIGVNEDGKREYFVSAMPSHLALLCANSYVKDGAAVLFPGDGKVLRMTEDEQQRLRVFIEQFPITKSLMVHNNTYEVAQSAAVVVPVDDCNSSTATRYFNSKVNVSNTQERVLVTLLTGLSFEDVYSMTKHNSVAGIPRDLTIQALNNFEHKYGRTPDVQQLALPNLAGNNKGYMAARELTTHVGQRVEADFFECEFNEEVLGINSSKRKKSNKLASHGGAIAVYISVDTHSNYVHASLVTTTANAVERVRRTVEEYCVDGHTIKLFAADQGILVQSLFSVSIPKVEAYLLASGIRSECGEAYKHNNGTPVVERTIRTVKELVRFAMLYLLRNPNFPSIGFTKLHVLKLWGELISWSVAVINLKPCPSDLTKTRFEIYHKRQPDLRSIRLLPIFSVLHVHRCAINELNSRRDFWQRGLYVGPSMKVPGAVRVVVLTKGVIKIITSTNIKAVSDGGDINVYPVVDRAIKQLLAVPPVQPASLAVQPSSPSLISSIASQESTVSVISNLPSTVRGADAMTKLQQQNAARVNRARSREEQKKLSANSADELIELCCFVDWTQHAEESFYLSFTDNSFIVIEENNCDISIETEESYRAVTENVPRNFTAALQDPQWGDAARKEFYTIMVETKAIVEINQDIARSHIRNGAEVLRMIAVYEEKVKEGVLVRKVRLVADGRHHHKHGATYSPTPSREELLIILHIFAARGFDYYHIDEVRAFLNVPKQDAHVSLAKFSGDPNFYKIINAVYGMKTASRDYQDKVAERMQQLGFKRLHMCSCVYFKCVGSSFVLVYDYVDDFICGGNCNEITLQFITSFRELANTTEPMKNAPVLLGMEVERDEKRKTISITMQSRIEDLAKKYPHAVLKKRNVPMPTTGYVVKDYEFENLLEVKSRFLTVEEVAVYMSIVGSLIWIQGVRLDIIFTVLYLSWFTKKPRKHHLDMAEYCLGYLFSTKYIPLVLGGVSSIRITGYTDASLGTGPQSRSILGQIVKLNEQSGAIFAKATAAPSTTLSSFEAELDGYTRVEKSIARVNNILLEMGFNHESPAQLYSDNQAMIDFVHGEGVAKGVRHMELRMWYTREEYKKGNVVVDYMAGIVIPTDKLTKLGSIEELKKFRRNILGLDLVSSDYML